MTFPIAEGSEATPGLWNRLYQQGGVNSSWFGAVGDGVTNDLSSINSAISYLNARGGGRLVLESGRSYYLGELSAGASAFSYSGLSGIEVDGQFSTFVVSTNTEAITYGFYLTNPQNFIARNLRWYDSGFSRDVNFRGVVCFGLVGLGSAGQCGNVLIEHGSAESVLMFLGVFGDSENRVRHITVNNAIVRNAYYGCNFQENGDDFRATNFRFENGRRVYFPYGVRDHNVDLSVYHDGTVNGANSCILIKRYERDTENIRVSATFNGNLVNYTNLAVVEPQPSSLTGAIRNVALDINTTGCSVATGAIPVGVRSYTSAGSEETQTNNIIGPLRIGGEFSAFGNNQSAISVSVTQSVPQVMALSPELMSVAAKGAFHVPGFRVKLSTDRELRTVRGNITGQSVTFPLDGFDTTTFAMRVRGTMFSNVSDVAAQSISHQEDLLFGYNGGGSTPIVTNIVSLVSSNRSSACTLSYSTSGENLVVGFVGSTYSTNASAVVEAQYLGKLPS